MTDRAAETSPDSTTPSAEAKAPPNDGDIEYPPFRTVLIILLGVFICSFLVALDRTIIGTAIPTITNEFNSLGDVGWYASAYLLCMCGFQLLFGRIYTFFNTKIVYLVSIIIFEVGSALCGAAPTSSAFIIGRAIAGVGAAGIFSGAIPIFLYILPLEKRPMWTGMFGMVMSQSRLPKLKLTARSGFWRCLDCCALVGGCFHRQGQLALVLLHQPSAGRCLLRHRHLYSPPAADEE